MSEHSPRGHSLGTGFRRPETLLGKVLTIADLRQIGDNTRMGVNPAYCCAAVAGGDPDDLIVPGDLAFDIRRWGRRQR
jgi:hypothetical protein